MCGFGMVFAVLLMVLMATFVLGSIAGYRPMIGDKQLNAGSEKIIGRSKTSSEIKSFRQWTQTSIGVGNFLKSEKREYKSRQKSAVYEELLMPYDVTRTKRVLLQERNKRSIRKRRRVKRDPFIKLRAKTTTKETRQADTISASPDAFPTHSSKMTVQARTGRFEEYRRRSFSYTHIEIINNYDKDQSRYRHYTDIILVLGTVFCVLFIVFLIGKLDINKFRACNIKLNN